MLKKKYQIYGFSYINDEKGMNVLNGSVGDNWDEVYEEFEIACFNGVGYFKSNQGCFVMHYPKFNQLTNEGKKEIELHCGYIPEKGEYGCICSTFGVVSKVSQEVFDAISKEYPVKTRDCQFLPWLNGSI